MEINQKTTIEKLSNISPVRPVIIATPPLTPLKRNTNDLGTDHSALIYDNVIDSNITSAKRALFKTSCKTEFENIRQVCSLNPYTNKYTIKVKVVQKSPIKYWRNSRGEGKVFNAILQDLSGEIRATAFNDFASKFHSMLEVDKVYALSNAQIGLFQNKRYNTTSHDYKLHLGQATSVVHMCEDILSIALYEFMALNNLSKKAINDVVDVVGICTSAENVQHVNIRRTGQPISKRNIIISDETLCRISVTLWDSDAENFVVDNVGKMVVIKRARVIAWQDKKKLSVSIDGEIQINPKFPNDAIPAEVSRLRLWDLQAPIASKFLHNDIVTLADIKLGSISYGVVDAFLIEFRVDPDNLAYRACTQEGCRRRKILETSAGSNIYCCQSCGGNAFTWQYVLCGTIADDTGAQQVTIFDEAARAMMGNIAASEAVASWKLNFKYKDNLVRQNRYFKRRFHIQCKRDPLKIIVQKFEVVSYSCPQHKQWIKHEIERLKRETYEK